MQPSSLRVCATSSSSALRTSSSCPAFAVTYAITVSPVFKRFSSFEHRLLCHEFERSSRQDQPPTVTARDIVMSSQDRSSDRNKDRANTQNSGINQRIAKGLAMHVPFFNRSTVPRH